MGNDQTRCNQPVITLRPRDTLSLVPSKSGRTALNRRLPAPSLQNGKSEKHFGQSSDSYAPSSYRVPLTDHNSNSISNQLNRNMLPLDNVHSSHSSSGSDSISYSIKLGLSADHKLPKQLDGNAIIIKNDAKFSLYLWM